MNQYREKKISRQPYGGDDKRHHLDNKTRHKKEGGRNAAKSTGAGRMSDLGRTRAIDHWDSPGQQNASSLSKKGLSEREMFEREREKMLKERECLRNSETSMEGTYHKESDEVMLQLCQEDSIAGRSDAQECAGAEWSGGSRKDEFNTLSPDLRGSGSIFETGFGGGLLGESGNANRDIYSISEGGKSLTASQLMHSLSKDNKYGDDGAAPWMNEDFDFFGGNSTDMDIGIYNRFVPDESQSIGEGGGWASVSAGDSSNMSKSSRLGAILGIPFTPDKKSGSKGMHSPEGSGRGGISVMDTESDNPPNVLDYKDASYPAATHTISPSHGSRTSPSNKGMVKVSVSQLFTAKPHDGVPGAAPGSGAEVLTAEEAMRTLQISSTPRKVDESQTRDLLSALGFSDQDPASHVTTSPSSTKSTRASSGFVFHSDSPSGSTPTTISFTPPAPPSGGKGGRVKGGMSASSRLQLQRIAKGSPSPAAGGRGTKKIDVSSLFSSSSASSLNASACPVSPVEVHQPKSQSESRIKSFTSPPVESEVSVKKQPQSKRPNAGVDLLKKLKSGTTAATSICSESKPCGPTESGRGSIRVISAKELSL